MQYGLIEWDGSVTPSLIRADTIEDVERIAARLILNAHGDYIQDQDNRDNDNFLDEHPAPDLRNAVAVGEWLEALHIATTVPYFTRIDVEDLVTS